MILDTMFHRLGFQAAMNLFFYEETFPVVHREYQTCSW